MIADSQLLDELEADLDLLSAELVARQDELVALYALTEATRSELAIDPVVTTVLTQIEKLFGVEHAFVALDGVLLSTIYPADAPLVVRQTADFADEGLIQQTFAAVISAENDTLDNAPSQQYENLLAAPVNSDIGIVAVLGVINKREGDFLYPDRQMLRTIATWLGAHIDSVLAHLKMIAQTRLNSEMELARRVQSQLLPQSVPTVAGLEIAGLSHPAFEVGGDFYDFLPSEQGLLLTVADVSGKGMSAAMLMGMVRTTMRNAAQFMHTPDAAELMHATNASLYSDFTDVGMLATALIAHYAPNSAEICYANAGHSPVVYCPAGGKASLLEADGTALGVLDICFCETQRIRLAAGDVLLVGSDGIVEARNAADELFGYDRLLELVETYAHESAETLTQTILKTVNQFAGDTAQDDDQTIVILKGVARG